MLTVRNFEVMLNTEKLCI